MRGDSEDDREDRAESAGRGIHWFRNDLRLHDNTALAALADRVEAWLPVFVLDPELLGAGGRETPRARFLLGCVDRLGDALARRGVPLQILEGEPAKVLPELVRASGARVVSWNVGATPLAQRRWLRSARAGGCGDRGRHVSGSHGLRSGDRTGKGISAGLRPVRGT
ncbi:MAG: deoxyribodipyrimidine photo-lyase [Myxococcota bacterium]